LIKYFRIGKYAGTKEASGLVFAAHSLYPPRTGFFGVARQACFIRSACSVSTSFGKVWHRKHPPGIPDENHVSQAIYP
jgi:hypothetical protein